MWRTLTLISGLLFFQVLTIAAQPVWSLKVDKPDFKVFTRPTVDSRLNAIRVEFQVQASVAVLQSVLLDVKDSPDWLYSCKTSYIIRQVSDSDFYYYTEVEVPWPGSNRDFVSHLKMTHDHEAGHVIIDAPATDDHFPKNHDIVRIDTSFSRWTLIPETGESTKVIYELEVDPGGSIPSWLINFFSTKGPQFTIEKLKERLKDMKTSGELSSTFKRQHE